MLLGCRSTRTFGHHLRTRSEFAAAVIIQGVAADRPGEEKTFKCYELDVTLAPVQDEGEMDPPYPAGQPNRLSVALRARPMSDLEAGPTEL
jgi:hypothetical protein